MVENVCSVKPLGILASWNGCLIKQGTSAKKITTRLSGHYISSDVEQRLSCQFSKLKTFECRESSGTL